MADVTGLHLGEESNAALINYVAMPRRLHEGDTLRLGEGRVCRRRALRISGFGSGGFGSLL
jgi:hypothetical protein